jgi:DNA invertase Pin-like site-specific DNA recombinase
MKHQDRTTGVLYCRYSSHSQREVSIDQQIKECRKFADRNGIEIVKVYDDRAMTGTNDRRPQFQQMLSEAETMAYQYVIVYSLDRFARDRYDSAVYKRQLKQHGKKVLSATENISDDPTGILMESLLEGLAEYYSKELSRKIRRGMDDNAEKCLANGAMPYGYRRGADGKYEIVPEEAQIVQEIFRRVAAGESLASIYGSLNDRGLRTRRGQPWNKGSFGRLLSNVRYTGVYVYKDIHIPDGVPKIIDKEMFDAVQHYLKTKKNPRLSGETPMRRRRENGVYLLTGKIFCGKCKGPMVGISGTSKSGSMHYYYVCKTRRAEKTCDMKPQQRDAIEREVAKAIKDHILVDDVIAQLADYTLSTLKDVEEDGALPKLRAKFGEVEVSIGNLITAIEKGVFSEAMQKRLSDLEREKRALGEEIAYEQAKRQPDVSREDLIALMHLYKDGDIDDKDYQEKLIDAFVVAVYVYDDHLHIVFSPNAPEVDIDLPTIREADSQSDSRSYKDSNSPPNVLIRTQDTAIIAIGTYAYLLICPRQ